MQCSIVGIELFHWVQYNRTNEQLAITTRSQSTFTDSIKISNWNKNDITDRLLEVSESQLVESLTLKTNEPRVETSVIFVLLTEPYAEIIDIIDLWTGIKERSQYNGHKKHNTFLQKCQILRNKNYDQSYANFETSI